jgi:hypothetical protein
MPFRYVYSVGKNMVVAFEDKSVSWGIKVLLGSFGLENVSWGIQVLLQPLPASDKRISGIVKPVLVHIMDACYPLVHHWTSSCTHSRVPEDWRDKHRACDRPNRILSSRTSVTST